MMAEGKKTTKNIYTQKKLFVFGKARYGTNFFSKHKKNPFSSIERDKIPGPINPYNYSFQSEYV